MIDEQDARRFELLALPHLDAAYNLARWLTHNDQDAQDAVQEACLRALRYFSTFRGDQVRPRLLQIVRNTCYSWLAQNRPAELVSLDDESIDMQFDAAAPATQEPHATAVRNAERLQVNQALAALPVAFREVLVLRELEELSYKDIAKIAGIPVGTVMSRLSRARALLPHPATARPHGRRLSRARALLRQVLAPGARPQLRSVARTSQSGVK